MFSDQEQAHIRAALEDLQSAIHANAKNKGWHDEERSFGDDVALIHSELSEALEAYRDTGDVTKTWLSWKGPNFDGSVPGKPEGVASEYADVIIRVLDSAEARGIPVIDELFAKLAFNATRPHRHGGKHL
ncbi:hypothetical protein [Nocardia nova]|uniref:hypothetical protein n=1 Tax=Nocardia nova TaxID=37330 RepID=UPI0027397001|nr:hypothetical protein [Nocardia nova]